MATESPMRLVESSVGRKWPSSEEASKFVPSSGNMEVEDLGLLLKGHSFNRTERDLLPGRSGSAPPSMEGSVAAIKNLLGQQSSSGLNESLASLNHAIKNCESEEQLRADAAYLKYYDLNVNLNPRLPPPRISRENRHRVHHIGGFGNNSRWTSSDVNDRSLLLSQGILSTHEEEPEDDRSPGQAADDWLERSSGSLSGQYTASLAGRHKSLVDLIQEDFPRTPSPVYNQSRSLGHATADEDHTPCGSSLLDSSVDATKLPDLNVGSVDLCGGAPMLGMNAVGLTSNADSSVPTMPSSSSPDGAGNPHIIHKGESSVTATNREDDTFTSGVNVSHMTSMESEMKALSVSTLPNTENHRNQREWRHNHHSNSLHHHTHSQRNTVYQSQGVQSHLISSGLKRPYGGLDQFSHGAPKLSSVEVQTMYPTSGVTPPLYATATAYMGSGNPFYPNLQTSGLFAPQYGVGGYALNTTVLPPFIAGYPSHSMIPMPFDGIPGPNYNSRTPGVSNGGNVTHGVDLQNLNKFYGHVGLTLHPPFADPHYMQYFQNPFPDAYGASRQYDPLASRGNVIGSQVNVINSHKDFTVAGHMGDQIHQNQHFITGGLSIPNTRKGEITTPGYYGSPPSMGVLMQFPTSPLASPVLPASPVGGTSLPGKKNEMRLLSGSSRNAGISSGWQGQRGIERFDDPKAYSFLEELKSSKSRKFELSDIAGRIIEFSSDQHGSRFIQQKLENCTFEEKASVFIEVLPHASKLMTDVFGNYVIQKFFEHGSPEERRELANQLAGQILPLSLQMYGCRVIQKALEVIELDQKTQLVYELDGHVMRCVRDQNGNHVIQKCIECIPTDRIGFIISSFRGEVATLSTHPYGCRVIQRVLEHCTDSLQSQCIVDEILESACVLAQDQYGNYVTQHVLERGKPHERNQIITKLAGQIVQMSQHKFASNVVEKCLEHGDAASRELLIEEIVGQTEGNDNLLTMMKDQFANYVVQKILETCSDKQREVLLNRIRIHLHALKKYTYGKHIVARFEQLSSEENSLET